MKWSETIKKARKVRRQTCVANVRGFNVGSSVNTQSLVSDSQEYKNLLYNGSTQGQEIISEDTTSSNE